MKKFSLTFTNCLMKLCEGEHVNMGDFRGNARKEVEKFITDGVLEIEFIGTHQRKIYCKEPKVLTDYLHHKYAISSLEVYKDTLEMEAPQRSDAVLASSDSKIFNARIFEGFLINTYDTHFAELRGSPFVIKPIDGAYSFIYDINHFRVGKDVTIVGVENYQNFRDISKQKHLFKNINTMFLWRYQNSQSITRWLSFNDNKYIHFGDFDPKGLHIYLSEFRNKLGEERTSFFIPDNLDELMEKYGSRELYDKQLAFFKNEGLQSCHELQEVVRIIGHYKKGLSQEILIQV